jgi:hypothetical protein
MSKPKSFKPFKPCKACPDKRGCTLNKECKKKDKKKKKSKRGSRNIYNY